jgi:hypothetical protein
MPSWLNGLKRPILIGFAAAFVTAIISLFMPNYYKSEARLLPVSSSGSSGVGQLAAAAAAFGVSVPGQDGADANYIDILSSRWLREQLLKTQFQFNARSWRFGPELSQSMTLLDYIQNGNTKLSQDRAVLTVGAMISASRDIKSKVLIISAETKSPELSQQLVQNSISLLETFIREKGQTRGSAKAAFAEARLKEAREEMTQAENEFRNFLEGNRNYTGSTDPSVRIRGARLEAELNLHRQLVTTLAVNREQALLEEKNDMSILNGLDPGNLPIDKSRPARSTIVLFSFFLISAGTWAWLNREWIQARMLDADCEVPNDANKESV